MSKKGGEKGGGKRRQARAHELWRERSGLKIMALKTPWEDDDDESRYPALLLLTARRTILTPTLLSSRPIGTDDKPLRLSLSLASKKGWSKSRDTGRPLQRDTSLSRRESLLGFFRKRDVRYARPCGRALSLWPRFWAWDLFPTAPRVYRVYSSRFLRANADAIHCAAVNWTVVEKDL